MKVVNRPEKEMTILEIFEELGTIKTFCFSNQFVEMYFPEFLTRGLISRKLIKYWPVSQCRANISDKWCDTEQP